MNRTVENVHHRLHLDRIFNIKTHNDTDDGVLYQFMLYGNHGTPQGEWIRRRLQDGWIPVPTQPEHVMLVCISGSCLQKMQNTIESLQNSGLDMARLEDEISSRYQVQAWHGW